MCRPGAWRWASPRASCGRSRTRTGSNAGVSGARSGVREGRGGGHHLGRLSRRQRGTHRNREMAPRRLAGSREVHAGPPLSHRGLPVGGYAVIGPGADAGVGERLVQVVGALVADHVEMPGGLGARRRNRKPGDLAQAGLLVVARGRAATVTPPVEVRELDAENGGLQLVQTRVVADELEGLLVA